VLWLLPVVAMVALAFAPPAPSSQRVAANVTAVSLAVNDRGDAVVSYTSELGRRQHVLAWGGVDATHPGVPQPVLSLDYSGGSHKYGRKAWERFHPVCGSYDGTPLIYLVAACKARDGSYWGLQAWQRTQPLRGVPAFRKQDMDVELRISHWTGPLAELEVHPNWTYGGTLQGLFGRLTYAGVPVFGTRTPSTRTNDPQARYIYIDTFNSAYGPGWKREGAKVTHARSGGFCYSFAPIPPPRGYPDTMPKVPGNGERHRITAVGPGLTPDVEWVGAGLGPYDPAKDAAFNSIFDKLLPGDRSCASER
jgi:hypothetical protein